MEHGLWADVLEISSTRLVLLVFTLNTTAAVVQ